MFYDGWLSVDDILCLSSIRGRFYPISGSLVHYKTHVGYKKELSESNSLAQHRSNITFS